jgi:poly-gamma-glutamate capsule biosynthesis protein CapA/YwtB (metallophosphatase superfamily)
MTIKFVAVGDVAQDREDPATSFDFVRERIGRADLGFCQLEVNLTTRGTRLPQARHTMRGDARIADALVDVGLNVVSFAGNHCMDWGPDGLFDTLGHLERVGAHQVGTGKNITEARKPVYVTVNDVSVAVISVNSILPMNYWAEDNRAGCAPMRAHTVYEQIEHDQPGTPARVHTYSHREDLEALLATIRETRQKADVVVLSHHAGIHFVPAVIPDYQKEVAYAAIDAGADLVLGSHAHILKGIEIYKGKTIAYSMANFAIDLHMDEAHAQSKGFKEIQKLNPNWVPDFGSRYNFPPGSEMSMMLEANFSKTGVSDVRFVPVMIGRDADPKIVPPEHPDFARIQNYLQEISDAAELGSEIKRDGDTLRVDPKQ